MKLNKKQRKLPDTKCKTKGCKRSYLIQGYCCKHYLMMLDKFEKKSKENPTKQKVKKKSEKLSTKGVIWY